tara:strand:+ start:828 stop:1853 length:1026 start_codon:yes stop_codon:yes gene_type:complete
MATYKEIQGTAVQSLASSTGTIEGQIWYDTANGNFKLDAVATADSWSSGTSYPANIRNQMGAGSKLAAVQMGGYNGSSYVSATNEYDGSAWTSSGALPAPQADGRAGGPQTDVIAAGGFVSGTAFQTTSLSYNGSTWSPTPSLNTGRNGMLGASTSGDSTAFLIGGGQDSSTPGPPFATTATEEYNGSTWTSVNSMTTARYAGGGAGTQTSGLAFGGNPDSTPLPGPYSNATEEYDGTNWTNGGNLNTARSRSFGGGENSNSAVAFGGQPGPGTDSGVTEKYDGTSWTTSPVSNSARSLYGRSGLTQGAGLISGGYTTTEVSVTEEWTGSGSPEIRTITTS